jgi:hypothetical protein
LVEPPEPKMEEGETYDLIRLASDVVQIETVTYAGDLVVQWGGDDVYVLGNSVELRRAIANLVSNATRAAGPDGKVVVELRRDADRVLLTVDDSGPGFGRIRRGVGIGSTVARGLKTYEALDTARVPWAESGRSSRCEPPIPNVGPVMSSTKTWAEPMRKARTWPCRDPPISSGPCAYSSTRSAGGRARQSRRPASRSDGPRFPSIRDGAAPTRRAGAGPRPSRGQGGRGVSFTFRLRWFGYPIWTARRWGRSRRTRASGAGTGVRSTAPDDRQGGEQHNPGGRARREDGRGVA